MFMNKIQNYLQAVLTTVYCTHKSKTTLENPGGIPGSKMLILLWVLGLQTTIAPTSREWEFF